MMSSWITDSMYLYSLPLLLRLRSLLACRIFVSSLIGTSTVETAACSDLVGESLQRMLISFSKS